MDDNLLTNITLSMSNTTDQELIQYQDPTKHEPFVSVFLVPDLTILERNRNVLNNIRHIASDLQTFCNPDECINYITDLTNEKVILNISDPFSKTIVPLIHDIPQLSVIYITSDDEESSTENNTDLYPKIRNVYDDIVAIFEHVPEDKLRVFDNYLGIKAASFKLAATPIDINGDVHRQDASFMYGQILKDILLTFPFTEESKRKMIKYCRKQYADDSVQRKLIDKFEKTYKPRKAVRWITRDSFLYRLLNKALRLQDIDALYKMRFYIHDLDQQIFLQHIHFIQNAENLKPFTVYRGFGMSNEDFNKLKTQDGGFMSFAEFVHTSRDYGFALGLALACAEAVDHVGILLEIELDVKKFGTHFTDVRSQSWMPDEEEILFTMGTVFRMKKIYPDERGIWIIKLSLTGEEDNELRLLYEHMRKDFMEASPLSNLAKLMLIMGNNELAKRYYNMLLQDSEFTADFRNLSDVYYYLGRISTVLNQQKKAIAYYKKSLDIKNKHLSTTDFSFTPILTNLGDIYREQGDYEKAVLHFKQALQIESNASTQDLSKLAALYNSLGIVYNKLQAYSEELDMFEKTLKIRLKLHPENRPKISEAYSNVATAYVMQKDFGKAIDLYNKAIQIQVKSLQPNHPTLVDTYNNLASALYECNKLREAIYYAKKVYGIQSKELSADHPKVKTTLKFITDIENELVQAEEEKTD